MFDNPKEARRADRVTQLALAAATEALAQAGEIEGDPLRRGVLIATGIGGIATLEEQILVNAEKGARRVSPFLVPMMMPNAASATVSMRWGWQGPCQTVSTACAAGTHALVDAAMWIASGRCDVVAAGGSEAAMTPDEPGRLHQHDRDVVAERERAVRRHPRRLRDRRGRRACSSSRRGRSPRRAGATILAEILGGASTADAHHITAPSPGGRGALSCMEIALASAGLTAGDIVHVNAHGTSTPLNDAAEAEAMAKLFGTPGPAGHVDQGRHRPQPRRRRCHRGRRRRRVDAPQAHPADRGAPPRSTPSSPPSTSSWARPGRGSPARRCSNSFGFGGHNGTLVLGVPA